MKGLGKESSITSKSSSPSCHINKGSSGQQPSLSKTKHHGSKAIIKQPSPCVSTRPITNMGSTIIIQGYIIMGSLHHHHPRLYNHGLHHIIQHIIRVIKGPSPYAISIRGPSSSISKAPSRSSIIIQTASYCDHYNGHSTSSS